MIVGIIGKEYSGRKTIAKILQSYDYILFDVKKIEDELIKKNEKNIAKNKLKQLIEKIKLNNSADIVILNITTLKEILELKKLHGFQLISIDAPTELRFLRHKEITEDENLTLREFKKNEDTKIKLIRKSELERIIDGEIYNDCTIDELKNRIDYSLHNEKKKIPDWDSYFMDICEVVKTRSSCLGKDVGAVLVKNNQIISTGYDGPPKGHPRCDALGGCFCHENPGIDKTQSKNRSAHAEQNTIANAAYNGISTANSTLYCTIMPCPMCMRILINAGVIKIIYKEGNDPKSEEIATRTEIELIKFKKY
jgi:dCMP deaminase